MTQDNPKADTELDATSELREAIRETLLQIPGAEEKFIDPAVEVIFGRIAAQKQRWEVEARKDELQGLLHTGVCEVMCRWSKICDVQGKDCPKIRKRIAALDGVIGGRDDE